MYLTGVELDSMAVGAACIETSWEDTEGSSGFYFSQQSQAICFKWLQSVWFKNRNVDAASKLRAWVLFWPFKVKNVVNVILIYFTVLSSVPVEEQEEFKQLTDDIQELQQSLNQEFRQKTVSVMKHLEKIYF